MSWIMEEGPLLTTGVRLRLGGKAHGDQGGTLFPREGDRPTASFPATQRRGRAMGSEHKAQALALDSKDLHFRSAAEVSPRKPCGHRDPATDRTLLLPESCVFRPAINLIRSSCPRGRLSQSRKY